ncbi:cytochrome P450 [Thelephora terrestris]|uniref:Cytochrome P450 n=1 Tax=Thelephora terrestris TaxID=56493 RepID=A0A9P6HEX4_9AGAM|nr:cytochrome P450 [Thelephora terrestris]
MDSRHATLAISVAFVAYTWYKCRRTSSISDIPGPKNPSWIYGHRWWWQSEEASVVEKRILEEYGAVARYNGSLGEHRLFVADPQAIYHILQGTSYLYEKPRVAMEMLALVLDKGLASVGGDAHKRQRRVISPAFGLVESKALYPYFARCANSIVDKWHEAISTKESDGAVVIDVHSCIGAGAFDYDFGAVENTDNKFTKTYTNMTFAAFGRSSKGRLLMMELFKWAPAGFGTWMMERDKRPAMVNLRENKTYAHEVAAKLIEEKKRELEGGTSSKDLLSLLVKANSAVRSDGRLDDEEIVSQDHHVCGPRNYGENGQLFAGFNSGLAKNRHVQEKLRAEITETLGRIRTRGDSDFAVDDFDSMPYLLAVGKEILRIYLVFTEPSRTPTGPRGDGR